MGVDPGTDKIYVTETGLNQVQVIDGATDTPGAVISILNLATAPTTPIAVDVARDVIWVTAYGYLSRIDGATNQVTGGGAVFEDFNGSVAVNPDTGYPYVADPLTGASDLRPSAPVLSVGFDPRSVAAGDPGSGVFFVSNCAAGWYSTVWEFSAATDQPLQQIGAPWVCPDGLAVHGGTVYAANSTLAILSVAGDAVTGGFSGVPAEGIAVDSATGVVYTTDGGGTGHVWAVPPQAPAFTSAGSTSVAAGSADTFWVQTSANPAPTYSETGQLPAGVHLASWGEIYLSPEAGTGGRYPVTISASDGVGTPSTQSFVLTVTQAAGFASAAKATFRTGRAGSFAIKVTGYPAPVLTETGSLPAGLKLAGHTISGTPAAGSGGTYRLTLTAANSSGPAATQAFVLTVNAAPTFTSPRTVTCHPGRSCTFTVVGQPVVQHFTLRIG